MTEYETRGRTSVVERAPARAGVGAAFSFGILGPLEVTGEHGPVVVTGARRRTLLLMLLVSPNRPVPVERLIEHLWEGDPSPGSASTFRSHLSHLRKLLPDRISTRHGRVVLGVRPGELDAEAFDTDVAEARRAVTADDVATGEARFQRALDRWRGAALADAAGSAWAAPEIARLEELRLGALEELLDARLVLGQHQRVVAEAEAAVAEHPLREHLWEVLMLALYRAGRQSDALRAYQRLRAHLDEEIGIEPSPGVTALEAQIVRHDPTLDWVPLPDPGGAGPSPEPAPPHPGAVPTLPTPPAPAPGRAGPVDRRPVGVPTFVGRVDELERLERALGRAARGTKVLAVVLGEPGIGKSRLAAELADRCRARGDLVVAGSWDEQVVSAFQGLRRAFGRITELRPDLLPPDVLEPMAGALRQVLPELWGSPSSDDVPVRVGEGEGEQFQAFEAFVDLVERLTAAGPLVVVLDDLQWADTSSLSLLEYVLDAPADVPLLIVATFRDTQPSVVDDLDTRLAGLRRRLDVERVDLGGLSGAAAQDLLAAAVGTEVVLDDRQREALADYTGGNPFFIQELALDLAVGDTIDATSLVRASAGSDSVPERLQELVRWRLSKLSEPCTDALAVGAVTGLEFEAGVVGEVAGVDEDGLLRLLDEALAASVVREVPGSPDNYRFSHDLVRQSLDAGLSTSRKIRMHRRIAQAMERRSGGRPSRAAEIGRHFQLGAPAGSADRAVVHLVRAGQEALRRVAYEAGVELFAQAVEVARTYAPEDAEGLGRLLLLLGDAQVRSGHLAEADEAYAEAFSTGNAGGDVALMAGAALGYGGVIPAGAESNPTAERLLRTTLDRLGSEPSRERALILGRLAHWGHFSIAPNIRREMADTAVHEAAALDGATLAACLEYRYWALSGPDDTDAQLRSAGRIRTLGEDREDPELVLRGMKCELHTHFERGDLEAASERALAMRTLASDIRQPEYLRLVHMWESLVAGIQGRFDDAARQAEDAFAIMRRTGHSQADTITVGLTLTWLWLQGRMAEFAPILEQAATGRASLGEQALGTWIASEIGQEDLARSTLDRIDVAAVRAHDRNFHWWLFIGGLANAVCNLGDGPWARTLYDLVSPYATHFVRAGQATFMGSASLYLGRLATVAGDPTTGLAHLEEALAVHRRIGAVPYVDLTTTAIADATARIRNPATA